MARAPRDAAPVAADPEEHDLEVPRCRGVLAPLPIGLSSFEDAKKRGESAPDLRANLTLLESLREHAFKGRVALTAHTPADAAALRAAGADLVLQPFNDAADRAAAELADEIDPGGGSAIPDAPPA